MLQTLLTPLLLSLYLAAQLAPGSGSPAASGRTGNDRMDEQQYEGAIAAYEQGLGAADSSATTLRAKLLTNLGVAYHRAGEDGPARAAFRGAADLPADDRLRARALYDLGVHLARQEEDEAALAALREALLLDPELEDARYNYEFVKRNLESQAQGQMNQPPPNEPPPPTAYARAIKARADSLVAQRQYRPALSLFESAARTDPSLQNFQAFQQRLRSVVQINDSLAQR